MKPEVYYDDNGELKRLKRIQYGDIIFELLPIDGNIIIRQKK